MITGNASSVQAFGGSPLTGRFLTAVVANALYAGCEIIEGSLQRTFQRVLPSSYTTASAYPTTKNRTITKRGIVTSNKIYAKLFKSEATTETSLPEIRDVIEEPLRLPRVLQKERRDFNNLVHPVIQITPRILESIPNSRSALDNVPSAAGYALAAAYAGSGHMVSFDFDVSPIILACISAASFGDAEKLESLMEGMSCTDSEVLYGFCCALGFPTDILNIIVDEHFAGVGIPTLGRRRRTAIEVYVNAMTRAEIDLDTNTEALPVNVLPFSGVRSSISSRQILDVVYADVYSTIKTLSSTVNRTFTTILDTSERQLNFTNALENADRAICIITTETYKDEREAVENYIIHRCEHQDQVRRIKIEIPGTTPVQHFCAIVMSAEDKERVLLLPNVNVRSVGTLEGSYTNMNAMGERTPSSPARDTARWTLRNVEYRLYFEDPTARNSVLKIEDAADYMISRILDSCAFVLPVVYAREIARDLDLANRADEMAAVRARAEDVIRTNEAAIAEHRRLIVDISSDSDGLTVNECNNITTTNRQHERTITTLENEIARARIIIASNQNNFTSADIIPLERARAVAAFLMSRATQSAPADMYGSSKAQISGGISAYNITGLFRRSDFRRYFTNPSILGYLQHFINPQEKVGVCELFKAEPNVIHPVGKLVNYYDPKSISKFQVNPIPAGSARVLTNIKGQSRSVGQVVLFREDTEAARATAARLERFRTEMCAARSKAERVEIATSMCDRIRALGTHGIAAREIVRSIIGVARSAASTQEFAATTGSLFASLVDYQRDLAESTTFVTISVEGPAVEPTIKPPMEDASQLDAMVKLRETLKVNNYVNLSAAMQNIDMCISQLELARQFPHFGRPGVLPKDMEIPALIKHAGTYKGFEPLGEVDALWTIMKEKYRITEIGEYLTDAEYYHVNLDEDAIAVLPVDLVESLAELAVSDDSYLPEIEVYMGMFDNIMNDLDGYEWTRNYNPDEVYENYNRLQYYYFGLALTESGVWNDDVELISANVVRACHLYVLWHSPRIMQGVITDTVIQSLMKLCEGRSGDALQIARAFLTKSADYPRDFMNRVRDEFWQAFDEEE
jgi:hypothetical protein